MSWTYPGTVVRVVDGDTVRLNLDLGLHIWRTDSCRIRGINTPELGTAEGRAAKAAAEEILPAGSQVLFVSKQLDKYGRPLGDLSRNGVDFAAAMLAAGHAVPYMT
jgi:endonuclease YncB( thermonuclease family)